MLVRLTTSNADDILGQALSGGADVRFTSSDGSTALSYEIDRWTSTAAEFWVLVPSVTGNSTTDIRIYWSKSGQSTASDGTTVFSTSNNYVAVWHLNENGNTSAGGYAEATSNNSDATGVNMTGTSDVSAAIGFGQDFNGTSQYLHHHRQHQFRHSNACRLGYIRKPPTTSPSSKASSTAMWAGNSGKDGAWTTGSFR